MNYELIIPQVKCNSKIETILYNRGIKDIDHYLNTSDDDIISPQKIVHMDDGIKMLIKHISNNDKMYMIVDEDCDGYSSSSLFINYLHCLFPYYVENYITYDVHKRKMHGVEVDNVPEGVKFVVILDAGSNQFDEHKILYEKGIDVLVIDHHLTDIPTDYKNAIIINNNATYEDYQNNYPTKALCGTAMTYKFCCRIDELLNTNYAEEFRDLVALAEISDMMDVREYEAIELIRQGIAVIRNKFIIQVMQRNANRFKNGVTMRAMAFYVVPFINAVTRVGSKEERLGMFEAMLDFKADDILPSTARGHKGEFETRVEQAARICSSLKQTRQTNAMNLGYDRAEFLIQEQNLLDDKFLIIQFESGIVDADINGLIANKLMAKYRRPVLVLQPRGDNWAGSGRGYPAGGLESFRDFLRDSGLVEYADGHHNAFGLELPESNIYKLKNYAKEKLKDLDFTPSYKVDFIWDVTELSENEIYEIADLCYLWGQEIDEPLVAVENIKITADNFSFVGAYGNTLNIKAGDVSFVKFFLKKEEKELLNPDMGSYVVDIVGKCVRDAYNDMSKPQIEITDFRIRNRMKYYF